ncbi:MAG TPA: CDP-alcohol phosphatidyltransferase family protein [Anaerohalosphaeraceae bacterium]|nr:CDP-alcohol phosphatidyltransferase family protein [Anaerohalosphaeraceae bacterium]HOL30532.1 CDP-alcohol phosphatidyltransferase family protein [Anaerohalosphaeraceae bacterium]HOM75217.1 CDP-alcohol phosphatidyltransferase family protein [Anaerohalosphaeraceae bacterium]HPC63990.1 CDP-alcohol phosphatidyltransferase family protein [Anaerohalosphaeraceae bacterium]HPO69969.1 CDP-alcohol phosphatidyltransferase family protein [Anaerohalosphaeraceae bacterium]
MLFTIANQITILRVLLVAPFVICLIKTGDPSAGLYFRWAALGLFGIAAGSDALDGFLARIRKQTTPLGTFLDPLADKLLITCACIILSLPQTAVEGFRLPLTVVVLIIGKDILLLLGFVITYFLTGSIYIQPVWVGKASTAFQILMVLSILMGPEMARGLEIWPLWTRIVWWITGLWALTATFIYIRRGIQYIESFGETAKSDSNR